MEVAEYFLRCRAKICIRTECSKHLSAPLMSLLVLARSFDDNDSSRPLRCQGNPSFETGGALTNLNAFAAGSRIRVLSGGSYRMDRLNLVQLRSRAVPASIPPMKTNAMLPRRLYGILTACFAAIICCDGLSAAPPNILFIAADDLRCDLGSYGNTDVMTPNLDRLADRSVQFNRAYCQQAVCNPSRSSLLTGKRPDTLRLWNLGKHFRDELPDVVTLPQYFKQQGYFAQNIGKVFHNWQTKVKGDPPSWSVPAVMHYARHGDDAAKSDEPLAENFASDKKCECRDVPDDAYFDGRIAHMAVEAIKQRSESDTPFFLAVGFWKPHAPFNAPKKYWDLYDRSKISMPHPSSWPKDAPRIAWHNGRELLGTPARKLTDDAILEMRHGYLAAISYLDAQIGKVLDAIDDAGLADDTIIVFWSDHGYHLGEQTLWAKTSNFELDARVPLMISTPDTVSGQCDSVVELLDLYPTLVDLAGLPAKHGLEGKSLTPLLKNPTKSSDTVALTQHPRPAYFKGSYETMGYSLRSNRFRYTEWRAAKTDKLVARELYDHRDDPYETVNVINKAIFQSEVEGMAKRLHEIRLRK